MFFQALPVWLKDRENELDLAVVFETAVDSLINTELAVAACTFYRVFANGRFVAFGPARTARGYARTDVLPLSAYDANGNVNTIRIEVVGYNCRSLSTCLQPSFLCAELRRGETVIACTGRDFTASELFQKEQKVERFSIQRHFTEVWDLTRQNGAPVTPAVSSDPPVFLPRVAPYPHYEDIWLDHAHRRGTFAYDETLPIKPERYSWSVIPEYWRFFPTDTVSKKPFRFVQGQAQTVTACNTPLPIVLRKGQYAMFDFSRVECGFLQLALSCSEEANFVVAFTEYCDGETFNFTRMNCHNVIEYTTPADFEGILQGFEPYTAQYAIVMVKEGAIGLLNFGIKTFEREMKGARQVAFKEKIHADIYNAALRTFAHNAVDLYSDCPSRERAGWLCDSYFTATAEQHFFGSVPVEDAFLENFRLFKDPMLDNGMLPMCYPADIKADPDGSGHHIPQWCMWYVLEVKEYLTERNPSIDKECFRQTVEGILHYFEKFENSDGLLEDLPSWNFVEWSDANKWTQNVNYPTNFLYAAVLLAACDLYGDRSLAEKARRIQARTAELSFDGELFTDNAVRDENGVLRNTGNTSEAGQYYALLFGNIDWNEPKYEKLRAYVLTNFKGAADTGRTFVPVNAFIGLYLRLKALLQLGLHRQILDDVGDFFGGMAEKTGTLWEYREMKGSHDHGFASYAAYAMCVALENLNK